MNENNLAGFVWARIPGCPGAMRWPVLLESREDDGYVNVFCRSDDADELANTCLPVAGRRTIPRPLSRGSSRLWPVTVEEKTEDKIKINYIGWPKSYDEWRRQEDIVFIPIKDNVLCKQLAMPRKRYWKKRRLQLQTDVTEDPGLDKNRIDDLINDMTEDPGLNKNRIDDLVNDVTEDPGLHKNRTDDFLPSGNYSTTMSPSGFHSTTMSPSGFHSTTMSHSDFHSTTMSPSGFHSTTMSPSGFHSTTMSPSGFHSTTMSPFDNEHTIAVNLALDLDVELQIEHKSILPIVKTFGTCHQASECFPAFSRGVQCTCNSMMSLVFYFTRRNTELPLDEILAAGDELYRTRIAELQSTDSYTHKMLLFNELPNSIVLDSNVYRIQFSESIYGTITLLQWNQNDKCINLQQGIQCFFAKHTMGLIIVGGLCSSIFLQSNGSFAFFDSHSHDKNGLSSVDGTSILFTFENLQHLTNFMFSFYQSCNISMLAQFEIQPISLLLQLQSPDHCDNSVFQNTQRKQRQSLIDKYFEDQQRKKIEKKEMCNKTTVQSSTDKRQYMTEYMRKRRENKNMQLKERDSTLKSKRKARQSVQYQLKELEQKKLARTNNQTKQKDRHSSLKSKSAARQHDSFRSEECQQKKNARQNPETKEKFRKSTLKTMGKLRQSEEFRAKEFQQKTNSRQNPETKEKLRKSTLNTMGKLRQSEEFRAKELQQQKNSRQNPETKEKLRKTTLKTMGKLRQSEEFRAKELQQKKNARQNLENKRKDQKSSLKSKTKARQNRLYCQKELKAKANKRTNPIQLERERVLKHASRQRNIQIAKDRDRISKALKRKTDGFLQHEISLSKRRHSGNSFEDCIQKFHDKAAQGPIFVCTCCQQTWFPKSVVKLDKVNLSQQSKSLCTGFKSVNDDEWLCHTCLATLREEKIPRLSVKNGMKWPEKPTVLNLHPLEERLISQRIPFMQIRELPRGGQLSAKGNVVNVPVDIQPTVNALPRQIDEHVTVAVKLKKRLSHKSSCFTENVRPNIVLKALEWLMNTSDLYKNSGISIDKSWKQQIESNQDETVKEIIGNVCEEDDRPVESKCDDFIEVTEDCIQGNSDTLIEDTNTDTNKVYVFAPGENRRPLSLYEDPNAEYLCFPTIFCGKTRPENNDRHVNVHYSDVAKWELRSVDRRAAQSVPNIFFKLKKIQAKQVSDKVNLALRRCKSEGKEITAGQVKTTSAMNDVVRLNEGYYIFRTLRNSPAYLASKKKDVFAMIRQLGLPTWFISLSSADTRWKDLLKTLSKLDGEILSDSEVDSLDWNSKTKLVQKNPVTAARFFDNRVQLFINSILKNDLNPLGKITDTFYRVEFQNRGSPHIHMLVWTNDAPKYIQQNESDVISYVDEYVTCLQQSNDPTLKELIDLQIHKHSKTCKKAGKSICRFGFPLPPLPQSMILEPLDEDQDQYRKKFVELQKTLNEYKDGCQLDYDKFLSDVVKMSEDEYIKCIRASLKGPKVFLKRHPSEMRVNYYNPVILKAWHANLDIQYVLDPYACATYIVSYISKSQRGVSAMLEKASQEAAEGNMDLKRQVRHIGNKFLNFVEVSAQEASYLILQMPLTRGSRDVVFINTSSPEERVFLLKHEDELKDLPDDSTDIKADNMIQRYAKRPKQLENWCLADVISELVVTFPEDIEKKSHTEVNDDDISQEQTEENEFSANDVIVHLKNGIKIRKRKNKRVIRYVGYSKKTNSENYYRERILLFYPWRNENVDILGGFDTYEQHYRSNCNIIQAKQKQYEHHIEELEQARIQAEDENIDFQHVAPNTEQIEAEDAGYEPHPSEEFIHFDPDTCDHRNYDIGPEIGLASRPSDVQTSAVRLPEETYYKLLQSLNCKQREFHNHVTKWIKHKQEPLFAFLTGGAGTGKSVVIDALYQTLHRLLCSEEGENPEDIRIMLCAYTGKAAYNINGTTIASALHKKMYQTQQNMNADELNSFRTKYRNLSVIIIDEISMVGNKLLAFINERLQQLTCTKQDFGDINIIAVGDLYQLPPVGDSWIFKNLSFPGQGLAKNLWQEHFQMFELTQVMRQKDDAEFAEILNRLRHNEITNSDKEKLSLRKVVEGSNDYPTSAPHLFIENKFVDNFNCKLIQSLNSEKNNCSSRYRFIVTN